MSKYKFTLHKGLNGKGIKEMSMDEKWTLNACWYAFCPWNAPI
jgi:hypothetical protein